MLLFQPNYVDWRHPIADPRSLSHGLRDKVTCTIYEERKRTGLEL